MHFARLGAPRKLLLQRGDELTKVGLRLTIRTRPHDLIQAAAVALAIRAALGRAVRAQPSSVLSRSTLAPLRAPGVARLPVLVGGPRHIVGPGQGRRIALWIEEHRAHQIQA
jgi:hypothetical protein